MSEQPATVDQHPFQEMTASEVAREKGRPRDAGRGSDPCPGSRAP